MCGWRIPSIRRLEVLDRNQAVGRNTGTVPALSQERYLSRNARAYGTLWLSASRCPRVPRTRFCDRAPHLSFALPSASHRGPPVRARPSRSFDLHRARHVGRRNVDRAHRRRFHSSRHNEQADPGPHLAVSSSPSRHRVALAAHVRPPAYRNVVATCSLDVELYLKTIAMQARNAEYNPKVRHSVRISSTGDAASPSAGLRSCTLAALRGSHHARARTQDHGPHLQ